MIGVNDAHIMYKNMEKMYNKLHHWGASKNLKFNPTKTVAVFYSVKNINQNKDFLS